MNLTHTVSFTNKGELTGDSEAGDDDGEGRGDREREKHGDRYIGEPDSRSVT